MGFEVAQMLARIMQECAFVYWRWGEQRNVSSLRDDDLEIAITSTVVTRFLIKFNQVHCLFANLKRLTGLRSCWSCFILLQDNDWIRCEKSANLSFYI